MRHLSLPLISVLALMLILGPSDDLTAQTQPLRPVTVGSPMPDFTLPVFQGGEVTLSELRARAEISIVLLSHSSDNGV